VSYSALSRLSESREPIRNKSELLSSTEAPCTYGISIFRLPSTQGTEKSLYLRQGIGLGQHEIYINSMPLTPTAIRSSSVIALSIIMPMANNYKIIPSELSENAKTTKHWLRNRQPEKKNAHGTESLHFCYANLRIRRRRFLS
jgi:hypothetical protein